jgi:hypothetical protein
MDMAAVIALVQQQQAQLARQEEMLAEQSRQLEFLRKDRDNLDALGMQAVSLIDCRWSNEEWDYIGVEQWPSMEAVRARHKFEDEVLEVARYVECKIYLGTPQSFDDYGKP